MRPNPVLKRLGFDDHARVVIIHADDVGMCQSTLPATADLMAFGLVSSASVMVPCAWFPAAAAYCRANPAVDMGVHTTLTAEWDHYRWGPISTSDPASGLIDAEGYFYRSTPEVQAHGSPEAVRIELNAQIERALAAGIDVTHVDTHMGAVRHPEFGPHYVDAAHSRRLPCLLPREPEFAGPFEEQGLPTIDHMIGMPLDGDKTLDLVKERFAALQPGITHFVIHPACDTPELRAIAPDWSARVADYELFMSEDLRQFVRDQQIHIIGYRALRDLMRR